MIIHVAERGLACKGRTLQIPTQTAFLTGELKIPRGAASLVLFSHSTGGGQYRERNQYAAWNLRKAGMATLLFDLLTYEEEADDFDHILPFEIDLLANRLIDATRWVATQPETRKFQLAYFGAGTGGAAALAAEAELSPLIKAMALQGGRPDLVPEVLNQITCPTLMIVGELDGAILQLTHRSLTRLPCEKELALVEGATHSFEEEGAHERVVDLAADWFRSHC